MKINSILKDHNYESIDSSLKVKYVVCFGNNRSQKRIELNPSLYKINSFTPKIRYKANDLRKEQFNSYSNENMDFFRLDHLCECDRNNYHNKFMDNIAPINRSENFDKFNKIGNNIKYLDYLKQNYLLNQNKKINNNIYTEKDLEIAKKRENYYKYKWQFYSNKINENNGYNNYDIRGKKNSYNLYQNKNIYNYNEFDRKINLQHYKRDLSKSNIAPKISDKYLYKNNISEFDNNINKNNLLNYESKNRNLSYSNLYLSNINDYSIKEGDNNFYKDSTKYKLYPTFQKEPFYNEKMKRMYNQDSYKKLLNNNPFYKAYNENRKIGFLKKDGDVFGSENLNKNIFFLRNDRSDKYNK